MHTVFGSKERDALAEAAELQEKKLAYSVQGYSSVEAIEKWMGPAATKALQKYLVANLGLPSAQAKKIADHNTRHIVNGLILGSRDYEMP